ncbi:MAG: translocation/assembly module TamB domain-containing protein, partial [Campylobacterales bacterium]|nr:translocation/assembly module TamB domain-containing protein [Campylobacterales bacterium]
VVKEAAKRFAPDYAITYSDISGNALQGITIHSPRYKGLPLAKQLTIRVNPAALLQKKISLTKVVLEEGNVTSIEALIGSFGGNNDTGGSSFAFEIGLEEVYLSLLPFERYGVSVTALSARIENILYGEDRLDIDALDLSLESNVTDIKLSGSYKGRVANIVSLSVKKVDLPTIQRLISDLEKTEPSAQKALQEDNERFYLPKTIQVDQFYLNTKPAYFDPLEIQKFNLEGSRIKVNLEEGIIEDGNVFLDARSNLSDIVYKGVVQENTLTGKIAISPHKRLFELSGLPLRGEAFGDIVIDLMADRSYIRADVQASATQILTGNKGEFNIDIDSLVANVVYSIEEQKLTSDTKVFLSTPYAKNIALTNQLVMDTNMTYRGEIYAKEVYGLDENLTEILHDFNVTYRGDEQHLDAIMDSDKLAGSFTMQNYQKGSLKLNTKQAIEVSAFSQLPEALEDTKATLEVDIPFDLDQNKTLEGFAQLRSNVVNIDAKILLDKNIHVKSKVIIPEDSLLRSLDPKIQWEKLAAFDMDLAVEGNLSSIDLSTKELNLQATYNANDQTLKGELRSQPLRATFDGALTQELKLNATIDSLSSLSNFVQSYYTLDAMPSVEGSAVINAVIDKEKKVDISLVSPQIVYQEDRKNSKTLSDVDLLITLEDMQLILQRYRFTYDKQKFYATQPSVIFIKEDEVHLSDIWVNDTLKTTGIYDRKGQKGEINTHAKQLKFEHEWADLLFDIDLATKIDGNFTDINGKITLQGGEIHYDVSQRSFASDSDIIIVEDQKDAQSNAFMDNLSIAVNIESNKPLRFKQADINLQAIPSLMLYKGLNEPLMLVGTIELLEGGTYIFENKKFTLEKSYIYFTGDPNKPFLEIKARHQAVKHLITIAVTGTPEAPNINFSSTPSLTREQILSVLLFDSEFGGDTYSGEEMMKMMGGAMAKSALVNAGVKIDHLVLGEGSSVEVGKKLTDNIMIIYINDVIPRVELRYRHTPSFESVVSTSEESSSYDIIYTKDF